jgi:demethoxyubiquinone hydroxylase (CLK1/Coq7/Cat5 family)
MASSGMLRRVALVRTDVSQELNASIIRVTRIGELGTKLVVTSNRHTLRRTTEYNKYTLLQLALFLVHRLLSP